MSTMLCEVLTFREPIECPQCYLEQLVTYHAVINCETHPHLASRFRTGGLHEFRCRACGHRDELLYCTLYHDPALDLMIWLKPLGMETEMPYEYLRSQTRCQHRRTVSDLRGLLELTQEILNAHCPKVA